MCSRVRSRPPCRCRASSCRLIAHNNEVLATKTTGADGRIDFDPGLSRGTGGSAPGLLVATLGDDYGFLNLGQPAFDLTDRGVSGRDAPSALDAFVYTERGVYRSGETVFVAALLRDATSEAKTGLPLTLVVKRPDGVEYKRLTVADQGLGGRAVAVPLLSDATAGKWTIDAYADPKGQSIGHAEFLLEDYVPERLDFALKTAKPTATPGEPIDVSLDARFLYGAPAAGLDVTGAIRLEAVPDSALAGFPGYVAGLTDDEFTAIENQFPDKAQTDDKGHVDLSVDLPDGGAAKPLEAKIIVDVAEAGGRTVERVTTLPVRAKGAMIGVKKDFDDSLGQGDVATFEAIAVAPDGTRAARKARLLVALPDQRRLPMVQYRRALELRAGQVVQAPRRRIDRHRSAGAGEVQRAGRLGPPPPRPQIRRRRGDEHQLRRRLVGNRRPRHAR